MKKTIFWAAAAVTALLAGAAGAGPQEGRSQNERDGRSRDERVSFTRMREVHLSHPEKMSASERITDDDRKINYPRVDASRYPSARQEEKAPPRQHAEITGNAPLVRGIMEQQRGETGRNRHYWHEKGGVRYSHYIDDRGAQWYGFYHGPRFYWSRFHHNRWWWFDQSLSRWVFWADGFWWWPAPAGMVYVYVDNNYYPYQTDEGGVVVYETETVKAPQTRPALTEGKTWTSPDGRRLVQIAGENSDSFLYDATASPAFFMAYLGKNAGSVRFSDNTILVSFKDGTYALYDMDGKAQSAPSAAESQLKPPSTTEQMPAPPETAPGQ